MIQGARVAAVSIRSATYFLFADSLDHYLHGVQGLHDLQIKHRLQ